MSGIPFTARAPSTAVTNAATVLVQATPSSASPITIHKIKLQSNTLTSSQAIAVVQWGFYATGTGSGTAITPVCPIKRLSGVSSNTVFKSFTTTMGTTFTVLDEVQWNICAPWDETFGMSELKIEVPASQAFAIILPNASGTPTINVTLQYSEY